MCTMGECGCGGGGGGGGGGAAKEWGWKKRYLRGMPLAVVG